MARKTWIKVSGTWKEVKNIWVKVSGVWTEKALSYINVLSNWNLCMEYPLIDPSTTALNMDWQSGSYSNYCAVDVTPDSMNTTTILEDTGDGIDWVTITSGGGSNTGDFQLRVQSTAANQTGSLRGCRVKISDDAGEADTVYISVTQQFEPD